MRHYRDQKELELEPLWTADSGPYCLMFAMDPVCAALRAEETSPVPHVSVQLVQLPTTKL